MSDRPICGDRLLPEGSECVLYPKQCGCAEGLRCGVSDDDGVLRCVKPGTKGVGDPCTSDTECGLSTICYQARCRSTCFETLDCGDESTVLCERFYDDKENALYGVCHRDCDPVAPTTPPDDTFDTCASTETCLPDTYADAPSCAPLPATPKTIGEACDASGVCEAGSDCVSLDDKTSKCTALCWVEGQPCPDGLKCYALAGQSHDTIFVADTATLGACL